MNVAGINLKDMLKYLVKIIIVIAILFITTKLITNSKSNINQQIFSKANKKFLTKCLELSIPCLEVTNIEAEQNEAKLTKLMGIELSILKTNKVTNNKVDIIQNNEIIVEQEPAVNTEPTASSQIEISKIATTEEVTDRNFTSRANNFYGTTRIDNQSNYTLTEDMLVPDVEIQNKKDILIYHTHTCESYTPCDTYNYEMTGNYRTTDSNYNVVRVGTELSTHLSAKGFNVIHDGTYHDYPSYSGSYARSLDTATKLLDEKPAGLVIDLHRDAVGNGDTYGPTVMVNGQRVAQLMFVIGTDGGGLEHPNWVQNLKTAIKIQETANVMYPGLFRSIIVRNSRYNQHICNGASIIEVGATANTLGECLLSMQCLANILEEVCK